MNSFQLGVELPREGFVQAALERNFASCERFEAGWADFACVDEFGHRWVIEAKDETSDTGLDRSSSASESASRVLRDHSQVRRRTT